MQAQPSKRQAKKMRSRDCASDGESTTSGGKDEESDADDSDQDAAGADGGARATLILVGALVSLPQPLQQQKKAKTASLKVQQQQTQAFAFLDSQCKCLMGHNMVVLTTGQEMACLAAQLSVPARALHQGAAVQRPRGGGKGDWCADCSQRRRFPPTHCPPPAEPPSAALPAPLADPTPGPAAARCRSAGRPPAPAEVDIRTVLWAVADTVRALAAGGAIGAKVLPVEGD